MNTADEPWYTLLRVPMDDFNDVPFPPHTTVSPIDPLISGDALMTNNISRSKIVNHLTETETNDENECVGLNQAEAFATEGEKSIILSLKDNNMKIESETGNRIIVANSNIQEAIDFTLEGSNKPPTTSFRGNVDLKEKCNKNNNNSNNCNSSSSSGKSSSSSNNSSNSSNSSSNSSSSNNNNNNSSELGDCRNSVYDVIKSVPIPDISIINIPASNSSISSSIAPQFVQEWDLPEATIPEITDSGCRPFDWIDVREQESIMKPVICYPYSSPAGCKVDSRTLPFQETIPMTEKQTKSQVLPFTKSRTETKPFPYQEFNVENTDLFYGNSSKHIDNRNDNNNNANSNCVMRNTDPPDIEKERFYCFDVPEPHPAPDCSQMYQIERLSVEHLEGTKEHYKPEWAHRNLAEYSNEETANIYGGYYTQDTSREPYSMGQTQMAKQDYPIERAHQSTEHIYTEHHTQNQYLFIDEQDHSCSSRPVPFLIKEERGGEERPGVSGEARSDDSSSEELGTAGGGCWLTGEDCGESYWAFSSRYVRNTSSNWQQDSVTSGDIWQFPGPSQMAIVQGSVSPQLPSVEDDYSAGGKRQETKKCGVCGDRALGYNFNAITCESCKAFFRRNALKNKEFRCPFQGQCRVDQVTRRFCQKCRLRKCLEIGMKKEWIMTEEEKRRKKQKIEENRARKIGVGQDDGDVQNTRTSTSSSSSPTFPPLSTSAISKPQAVVVGIIREEEVQPAKIVRLEGDIDVHHHRADSQVETANTTSDLRDYEYVENSPASRNRNTEDRDLPHLASTFPPSPSLHRTGEGKGSNPNLVEVFSLDIKREMECTDDLGTSVTESNNHRINYNHQLHHSQSLLHKYFYHNSPSLSPCTPQTRITTTAAATTAAATTTDKATTMSAKTTITTTITTPVTKEAASVIEVTPSPATTKTLTSLPPLPLSPPTTTITTETTKTALSAPPPTTTMKSPASPTSTRRQISNNNDIDFQGFSVREATAILHPEEKNTDGSPCAASILDALLDTTIRAEFTLTCSHNPTPSSLQALSETELIKLEELGEANKGILAPLSEDYNFKDLTNPSLINIINLTEIVIRRLIKMAKRINSFKNLCQEDQIALLKGGCTEMMLLHSVSAYDPDKDSWKIQQDHSRTKDIKLKVLKAATGNLYEEHKRFALAFDPEWKKDPHIIFLLCAITLFSPKRQHIIHTEAIRQEQGSYLYLTRRYLEVRYGTCLGRSTYHQLLHRLAHLHHLSEDHLRLFLEVNPTQVEPLLIEIFDLKQW